VRKNTKREGYLYRSRLAHNLAYFSMETEIFGAIYCVPMARLWLVVVS